MRELDLFGEPEPEAVTDPTDTATDEDEDGGLDYEKSFERFADEDDDDEADDGGDLADLEPERTDGPEAGPAPKGHGPEFNAWRKKYWESASYNWSQEVHKLATGGDWFERLREPVTDHRGGHNSWATPFGKVVWNAMHPQHSKSQARIYPDAAKGEGGGSGGPGYAVWHWYDAVRGEDAYQRARRHADIQLAVRHGFELLRGPGGAFALVIPSEAVDRWLAEHPGPRRCEHCYNANTDNNGLAFCESCITEHMELVCGDELGRIAVERLRGLTEEALRVLSGAQDKQQDKPSDGE